MSCSDATNNTTTTAATPTPTTVPLNSPVDIDVVLDLETQQLFIAQENIPAACEESKRQNQLVWVRSNSRLSIVRVVVVLSVLAVTLLTAIVAVCSGDLSKLSSAAVSLYNVAQTLALIDNSTLNDNGTSPSSEHVF